MSINKKINKCTLNVSFIKKRVALFLFSFYRYLWVCCREFYLRIVENKTAAFALNDKRIFSFEYSYPEWKKRCFLVRGFLL